MLIPSTIHPMDLNVLLSVLSGSLDQSPETKRIQEMSGASAQFELNCSEFPPPPGSIWRFKRYPSKNEHMNRILVTDSFESGLWTTVTVVAAKGVTAGDYTAWEWFDTFEKVI